MLRIGGFLEQSLIDWEGKIVSVIFTKGCNFRCGYCHNPSLVIPELMNETEDINVDTILSYFSNRKGWLDGVVISGGEPTIHKDLPDFLGKIKQTGLIIKVYTNGTNPLMIKKLIDDQLVDFISMDIKTIMKIEDYQGITNCIAPELMENIEESINILKSSNIQYQFRTTVIPCFHTKDILFQLTNKFKNDFYVIQMYRAGETIDSFNKL